MAKRILFVIRGKLGDCLLAFATVQAWRALHPTDEIEVLTARAYADLFADDALRIRFITANNRAHLLAKLAMMRLRPRYDVLVVLWGFGRPIQWIGRAVRASRKLYLDGRFGDIFDDHPPSAPFGPRNEPAWRVAQLIDPALPKPERLYLPRLARLREQILTGDAAVGLAPLANEPRRSASVAVVHVWLRAVARMYPGRRITILLNPTDSGAQALLEENWPAGVETLRFAKLDELVDRLAQLHALVATDTGLYHLAAAMGIPTAVFFGPTEPPNVILPRQTGCEGVRLEVLGSDHCEIKECYRPYCLDRAISNFVEEPCPTGDDAMPEQCPLRVFSVADYSVNRHWPTCDEAQD